MNEFDDLEKVSENKIIQDRSIELVRNKKAYMFMMLFDSSKITKDGITARAAQAFRVYKVHTWFLGKE